MKTLYLLIIFISTIFSYAGFAAAQTDKTPTWTYFTDGPVDSIAISSDDTHFVSGSKSTDGGTVYYFDNQGNVIWQSTQDRQILSVAISDDGSYVAAAGSQFYHSGTFGPAGYNKGMIYFFDKTGNLLWKYDTNNAAALQVSVTFDGSHVAVDTAEGILYLDKDGKLLWSHSDTSINDHPVKITKNGSLIATKDNQKLLVFDKNGTLLWENTEDNWGAFMFSDDGRFLATSADPSGIDLLDRNGKLIWKDEVGMHFISTSLSENGSYIAASAQQWGQDNPGGLFLIDNNARVLWQRPGDGYSAISSDGSFIVMGLWRQDSPSVLLYNKQGELLWQHMSGLVHSIVISHDGKYVIAGIGDSNYGDGSVQLFTNEQTPSELNTTTGAQNGNSPVIITQVELDSAFAVFPDNQTCYEKPGFTNAYTCSTDIIPGKKVQCAYFIGSSTCEPIHQNTGGTNHACLDFNEVPQAPQWFDIYNTQNETIQIQLFKVQVLQNLKPWSYYDYKNTTITLDPYQKCTYGLGPIDEPLSLDQHNMSFAVSYDSKGGNYTTTSPPLTDIENDSRTWQFHGNKWIFAPQNTLSIPEFQFAVPVLLISVTTLTVFYKMKFRK